MIRTTKLKVLHRYCKLGSIHRPLDKRQWLAHSYITDATKVFKSYKGARAFVWNLGMDL